jgi:hypothetical protein
VDYAVDHGVDLAAEIQRDGAHAADIVIEALHQLGEQEGARRKAVMANRMLSQTGTSVAEELSRQEREKLGENSVAVPEIGPFDISKVGKRAEAAQRANSFRGAQVVRDKSGAVVRNERGVVKMAAGSLDHAAGADSRRVEDGFEIGGKKVSLEKASRTFEDEAREIRAKTRSHFRA